MKRYSIRFFYYFSFTLAIILSTLQGCSDQSVDPVVEEEESGETVLDTEFVGNSQDTTFANAVVIHFDETKATVTNPFEGSGVNVALNNAEVVVTSTLTDIQVNYILSGIAANGSLKLYSDYKYNIILNGVSISNEDGPAINLQSPKKANITILDKTSNRLIDGSTYASSEEDQKGTFFSEGQLVFDGNGSLAIAANNKHGICSDDYISITNGNITVAKAASDGIHANDYFKMSGGKVEVTSSGDGIDAEEGYIEVTGGNISVTSVDDGITASYDGDDTAIVPYITITGGTIEISTSGDKASAVKSEGDIEINSILEITLLSNGRAGKGLKTSGDVNIFNASMTINTSGSSFYDTDDSDIASSSGINSDGDFTMHDGSVLISSTGSGGKGISVDGNIKVDGGDIDIEALGADFSYGGNSSEAKGIKVDGTFLLNDGNLTIAATDDGIKSETSITVVGGNIAITKSTEGIEAPAITFNNGTVDVISSDDCINGTKGNGGEASDGSLVTIAGGNILLNSSGGDPLDSNGNIVMTGGTVIIQGPPSSPEVALDYNGTFKISGGFLLASGPNAGGMIEATSTTSTQYTALIKVNGNVAANTLLNIQDASGNSLATYKPSRSAYYFVFSTPDLQSGSSYKVYTGGSVSGGTNVNGLTTGGTYSAGTLKGTFTVNSKVTTASL